MKVNENLKPEVSTKQGIRKIPTICNIFTINIPLISLEEFIKINGIEYFEINKKVYINNK